MESLTPGQRRTLAAREALARSFQTPEAKSDHYRAMARKANARRIVLSHADARVLAEAYRLLGTIVERTGLAAAEGEHDGRGRGQSHA